MADGPGPNKYFSKNKEGWAVNTYISRMNCVKLQIYSTVQCAAYNV